MTLFGAMANYCGFLKINFAFLKSCLKHAKLHLYKKRKEAAN